MTYVLHITISDVFSSEKVVTEGMVEGMKLEVRNLKKTYGTVQALKGISYTFTPGVYGILGANGAGKSTMINLITDNVSRDKVNGGSICYGDEKGDEDILKLGKQFRALVGYMPQQQGFYEDFSPKAFLKYMAEIKGVKKIKTVDENGKEVVKTVNQQIDELLEVVNLTKVAYKKIGGFSGGMKQRVLLAQALLGNPKILILDEPTAGLDPKGRDDILQCLKYLQEETGMTVILVSHSMDDVANYVNRIMVLNDGVLTYDDTPRNVFRHFKELEAIGLAAPQVTYIMNDLKQAGLNVNTDAITISEAKESILAALR